MSKKLYLYLITLFFYPFLYTAEKHPEKIMVESISVAEDITALILACKTEKNTKLISEVIKKLLLDTADLTETIIKHRRAKKTTRNISSLENLSFENISDSLETSINTIISLVHKSLETHKE